MVHLMTCNLAVLAIAMIYFSYRNAHVAKIKRRRVVQDRVAHMLWTAAHRMK